MSTIAPAFEGQQVRIVLVDGEHHFVAADVCAALGLTNVSMAVGRLDPDGVSLAEVIDSMGRRQQAKVVTEPGLYELILRSDRPEAKAFRRWVTHEVLPEIRRTGSFRPSAVEHLDRRALALMVIEAEDAAAAMAERAERAEQEAAALTPAAEAWEGIAAAEGDYSLREAAQMLMRAGVRTGQNRLMSSLRDLGWVDDRGRPYQQQVETGRLAIRTRTYDHPHTGEPTVTIQVRVTAKGVAKLLEPLGGSSLALVPGGA